MDKSLILQKYKDNKEECKKLRGQREGINQSLEIKYQEASDIKKMLYPLSDIQIGDRVRVKGILKEDWHLSNIGFEEKVGEVSGIKVLILGDRVTFLYKVNKLKKNKKMSNFKIDKNSLTHERDQLTLINEK